jgi:hypothetical protein
MELYTKLSTLSTEKIVYKSVYKLVYIGFERNRRFGDSDRIWKIKNNS